MGTFNLGGSVLIDGTGEKLEFDQKKHSYSVLNLGANDVYLKFNGGEVTANKTDVGEGKLWLIQNMGIEIPSDVHFLYAKTAAGSSEVLIIRNERDQ